MKRLLALFLVLVLACPLLTAFAEDGKWTCPSPTCGFDGNDGNFCIKCGQRKPEQAANACPHCGQNFIGIDDKLSFCWNCGKELIEKKPTVYIHRETLRSLGDKIPKTFQEFLSLQELLKPIDSPFCVAVSREAFVDALVQQFPEMTAEMIELCLLANPLAFKISNQPFDQMPLFLILDGDLSNVQSTSYTSLILEDETAQAPVLDSTPSPTATALPQESSKPAPTSTECAHQTTEWITIKKRLLPSAITNSSCLRACD